MARPKLDPKIKKARYEQAKQESKKLNKKLGSHAYTNAYATEWGKVVVYYEVPGKTKVRIRAPFPSIEFDAELLAAKQGQPIQPFPAQDRKPELRKPAAPATWRWACQEYFTNDPTYREMSKRDKRTRRNALESTWDEPHARYPDLRYGNCPLSDFNGESVLILMKRKLKWKTVRDEITGEEREVQTNFSAANTRHKFVSAVLSYLVQNYTQLVGGRNWARDIKPFKPENEDGHRTPSLEEIALFQSEFKLGTKERLLFDLAYYTTQRRADLPRLGRLVLEKDRSGNDRLSFVQHKLRNKKPVTAYVPIFPELRASLEAAKEAGILGETIYLVHDKISPSQPDRPYAEGSLGNMMQDAIKNLIAKTGMRRPFSLHGLRKAGVCRLIMMGLSVHQIMAITGHRTPKEIDRYGRDYMRSVASEQGYQRYLVWRAQNEADIQSDTELVELGAEVA
ncbi:tyrosine-type recombinase/integrase [Microvirga sp. 0TCS3.31]